MVIGVASLVYLVGYSLGYFLGRSMQVSSDTL